MLKDVTEAVKDGRIKLYKLKPEDTLYFLHWPGIDKTPLSFNINELWSWNVVKKRMFTYWNIGVKELTPNAWHNLLYILVDNLNKNWGTSNLFKRRRKG